jgi:transcriptional repressor of dcmA and dcmR
MISAAVEPILSGGGSMRDDELLDIRQAADLLKVSETSLRRWTNSGRLACLRVGRRRERRFRRADLMAFAEDQPGGIREAFSWTRGGRSGNHVLGVHATDGGRSDLAASFLADGLREGRATYLVASAGAHDGVRRRLEERYPIARSRVADELSAFEFVGSVDGQLDELEARFERALTRGTESLCLVGDATAVKAALSVDDLIDYEARYDARIGRRYPVVTLCLYDIRAINSGDLLAALKLHPDTFRHSTDRLFA